MEINFKYAPYKCTYLSGKQKHGGLCFSDGCDDGVKGKYSYNTIIFPKVKDALNYCFMSENHMLAYWQEVSRLLGFKLLSYYSDEKSYKLQYQIINDRRYFIYCSAALRFVYEYPFSLLTYCAWQNRYNFPELDIIQIMQFYFAMFNNRSYCHCPGLTNRAFKNINSKCQFNIIKKDFNHSSSFIILKSKHNQFSSLINVINTKQLNEYSRGINNLANKYYAKHKKDICRW